MQKLKINQMSMVYVAIFGLGLLLSACGAPATPAPTQDTSAVQTQAAQTVVADLTQNAPPPPTEAPPPTAVPTQAPPPGPTPDPNIPVAMAPTPAPGEPAATANYNTTVYSGPGTDYVVYASFLGGKTAKVVGKSEDGLWWAISIPVAPNGNGWVDGGWVTVSDVDGVPVLPTPPVPPTTEFVPPGPDDPQLTTIANTAVRTGPGTNYPAYGVAPTGATAMVIGKSEDNQWWVIRLNPEKVGVGHGWIMAQYTQASNVASVQTIKAPLAVESAPPPPPPAGAPVATTVEPVNVRSGPGTNYPVLVVAPAGVTGEVSGKSADGAWWQVKVSTNYSPTGFGWVSASYVTTQNTENVPVVEAPPAPPVVGTTPPPPGEATGCQVVGQDPADGTAFSPGSSFTTTWVLKNSGTDSWNTEYDLVFVGGASGVILHQGADRYDLSSDIEPGWTYNLSVPMITPFEPGVYGELWQVALGSQPVCQFYVYIEVR